MGFADGRVRFTARKRTGRARREGQTCKESKSRGCSPMEGCGSPQRRCENEIGDRYGIHVPDTAEGGTTTEAVTIKKVM
jgi:hypothetical protein